MMSRRWIRSLAVVFVFVLGAAACSSGGNDSAEDTTTTTGPELTGPPVKIMTLGEFSAGIAVPDLLEGAQAAVEAVNRDGGVLNGSPLELVDCDTMDDPNTAAECGRQAVDEGVVAIAGMLSVQQDQFYPLFEENQIPVVGDIPSGVGDFTSDVSFPISGGIVSASAGLANALATDGAERIAVARVDLAAASVIADFANQGLEPFGIETIGDVAVPENTADMAPFVQAVLQNDPDGVIVGLPGVDATNFVVELRQTAPDVRIAMTASEITDVIDALGPDAQGIFLNSIFVPQQLDTKATQQFAKDMEAAGFDETGGFRSNGYAAVMSVVELLNNGTEATAPAMLAALNQATALNPADLTPPINFTEGGVGGLPRIFNPCLITTQLDEDGVAQPVTDTFFDAFTGEQCVQPAGLG